MKRILALSILGIFLLCTTTAYAKGFSYSVEAITSSDNSQGIHKYKAFRLIPTIIYNKTQSDLSDMVIKGDKGKNVPYFINSYKVNVTDSVKFYQLKKIKSYHKKFDYYYDFVIDDSQSSELQDIVATSLEFKTNKGQFAKEVSLYGSYDNENWDFMQNISAFNIDGSSHLKFNFDVTEKYTYYRIKVKKDIEKISITSANLRYEKSELNKQSFVCSYHPKYVIKEDGKNTVIELQGVRNLRMTALEIDTDSIFKRKVSLDGVYSKTMNNLVFTGSKCRDLSLPMGLYSTDKNISELLIENNDDEPIKIKSVKIFYAADELVFDGSVSKQYTLYFGDKSILKPKEYDISNYKEQVLEEGYDVLNIGKINQIEAEVQTKKEVDYHWIFNIFVVVVALVLIAIALTRLKGVKLN